MNIISSSMTVLVVDDDHGHCELVRRNLRRAGVSNDLSVVHSGKAALDFIFEQNKLEKIGSVDMLVLLDINMPGELSGFDVLRILKSHPIARLIPIIMLTTTDDPRDINRCYELGCNVYVTKPVDPERFTEAVRQLGLLISLIQTPSTTCLERHG